VKDIAIEEQERAERLVLRRRADATLRREPRQKRGDLGGAHVRRMPLAMEENVPPNPIGVGVLGSPAVMFCANRLTNAIEQLRRPGGLELAAVLRHAPFDYCELIPLLKTS
jgi:hypothetical protein